LLSFGLCLISNLSLLSKIFERTVQFRLSLHLSSNNLLTLINLPIVNITLLKLLSCTYMIISSTPLVLKKYHTYVFLICQQPLTLLITPSSSLCLSSWFEIHGSVLDRFKSYLSSRSFSIKCKDHLFPTYACLYGVPQGSVPGPLLFTMYTIPLSILISSVIKPPPLCKRHTTYLFFLFL